MGVLIAAVAGILLASWLSASWGLFGGITLITALLIPVRKQGGLVLAFITAVFALLQLWSWNEAPARKLALWFDAHPQELQVQGIISAEPKLSRSGAASFPMRVERITACDAMGIPIALPVEVEVRWSGEAPVYGDRVSFRAEASHPPLPRNPGGFDYRNWLERHGIYTQFNVDPSEPGKILSHGLGNPIMALALVARHRMEAILSTDLEEAPMECSAIKGITLGVTENAPEGFTDDFRFTGTMHLFAVSGLHVGMLAVMIWFVLMAIRMPRPWAIAIIIPLLFFYVAITGLKSGSIRSASMISLLLCGSVFYRRAPSINTLAAAALIQLALDPNALFSAGWQFSYSVVFAILLLTPAMEKWLCSLRAPEPFIPPKLLTQWERSEYTAWKYLMGLLAISTAAWVGSLIPTIAYFHLVSFSAIGANLLAVPLAFAVLALGALALLTGGISLWVAGAFNNANWLITKLLLIVVQSSALLPGGHWFVGPLAPPYPVITVLDLSGASCAVVQSGGEFALVNAGRKRDAVRDILPFLESLGANAIENIIITKADAAHLGGVPEIARELSISRLSITSQPAKSPAAKKILTSFAVKSSSFQPGSFSLLHGVEAERLPLSGNKEGVLLSFGERRVLFLPRLSPEVAQQLLNTIPVEKLHAEVLVIPLGGSEILSALEVIRKIAPQFLITTADHLNRDGVPSGEWNQLLTQEKIQLLRQDETGAVTIEAGPKGMRIQQCVPQNAHASSDYSDGR